MKVSLAALIVARRRACIEKAAKAAGRRESSVHAGSMTQSQEQTDTHSSRRSSRRGWVSKLPAGQQRRSPEEIVVDRAQLRR